MNQQIRAITLMMPERTMVYKVGSEHTLGFENSKPIKKKIIAINFNGNEFEIWINSEGESQLWQTVPKNEYVKIEYNID